MPALVTILIPLIATVAELIQKAILARQEDHAAIVAEAQGAFDAVQAALGSLTSRIAAQDAAADAALTTRFAVPK